LKEKKEGRKEGRDMDVVQIRASTVQKIRPVGSLRARAARWGPNFLFSSSFSFFFFSSGFVILRVRWSNKKKEEKKRKKEREKIHPRMRRRRTVVDEGK